VDILVNNAGTILRDPAAEHSDEYWDEVLEVNLSSQFILSREIGRTMLQAGSGKIIFTASLLSFQGGILVPGYAASKGALSSLVKALSNEWAGKGVQVNGIAPGVINTPQLEVDAKNLNMPLEEVLNMYAKSIPLGRVGISDEIASVVAFLLDPEQNAMVGQIVNANGGEIRSRA
jgi:2-deoxy-D-gluconate 3-dehydrogenase